MRQSKLLFLAIFLFVAMFEGIAQQQANMVMGQQAVRVPKVYSTAGYTKASFDFTPEELVQIDEQIRFYVAKGYTDAIATHLAIEQIAQANRVETRIGMHASRTAIPGDSSLWIDRDPVIHGYTPTDLVRKVLLKSYSAADEARIQNVSFLGTNWDGSTQAWTNNSYDVNTANTNGWHQQGWTDPQDRSLVYFQRGPGVDSVNFEFDKGLLLATGPTYSVEGPYEVFVGTVNGGVKNDGTFGFHTSADYPGNTFDQDLQDLTDLLQGPGMGISASGSVLEFDFQPALDKATFDYIFACDEYPTVNSLFDVFGFFVTGPYDAPVGSGGTLTGSLPTDAKPYSKTNIATLPPGSTGSIVTILNINPITNFELYRCVGSFQNFANSIDLAGGIAPYFTGLGLTYPADTATFLSMHWGGYWPGATPKPLNSFEEFMDGVNRVKMMEYGGYSTKLTAIADSLIPGKWYRLKLGVSQTNSASGGTGVFLTNLDLGNAELGYAPSYMGWIPQYDSLGMDHLYVGCPQNVDLNFQGNGNFKLDILGDPTLKDYIDILSLSINGEELDVSKISWGDTISRLASDTVGVLNISLQPMPAALNAISGSIVSTIIGGSGDTINLSFFNRVEYDYKYSRPTAMYEGKLDLNLAGASNKLFRSIDNGASWEFARDTITGEYKPFSKSQVANLEKEFTVLLKEPNSCWMDTLFISTDVGYPAIQRLVVMPTIVGAVCDRPAGENYIESQKDFVFNITPTGSNMGMGLKVTTSRTSVPDSEGVVITKNEDGSYTVTIRQVQEPIEVYIDFVTSNAEIEDYALWSNGENLYIQSEKAALVRIYTISGLQVQSISVTAGETKTVALSKGFYAIMVGDSVYKIVIK